MTRLINFPTDIGVAKLADIKHFALDLDGTLYLGSRLFEWTHPFLKALRERNIGRTFFTNNSSRSTAQYVQKLQAMGIDATENEIYSSTHCTMDFLREVHPQIKKLYVLGTPALREEFAGHGFALHGDDPHDEPDAVVVGFDTTLVYDRLCRAAWWISRGKKFFATHPDRTCPTDQPTVLVDCGAMCAMLESATGRAPDAVLGKPDPRMLRGVMQRHHLQANQIAVVGDRLYTDIAMAHSAGALGILVLSGEANAEDAAHANPKPHLVVANVGEILSLLP